MAFGLGAINIFGAYYKPILKLGGHTKQDSVMLYGQGKASFVPEILGLRHTLAVTMYPTKTSCGCSVGCLAPEHVGDPG